MSIKFILAISMLFKADGRLKDVITKQVRTSTNYPHYISRKYARAPNENLPFDIKG